MLLKLQRWEKVVLVMVGKAKTRRTVMKMRPMRKKRRLRRDLVGQQLLKSEKLLSQMETIS